MSINFAAVHERKSWRKHRIHQTLHAAVDGNDGAKNLLRRIGRVAGMWRKYGDVKCVFVWEDGAMSGQAFRLAVSGNNAIESATLGVGHILKFDTQKGCNQQEIADCFRNEPAPQTALLTDIESTSSSENDSRALSLYPDDLPAASTYIEGLAQQILINRYERSPEARAASIAHYGCVCQVCKVDFGRRYGPLGAGFIHVHHVVPISTIGEHYRIDPIVDLVPVCPNCHAMLHRYDPPLRVEDLRALLSDG